MSERRPFSLAARLLSLLAVGLLVLQVGVFALTVHFRFEDQFRMAAQRPRPPCHHALPGIGRPAA